MVNYLIMKYLATLLSGIMVFCTSCMGQNSIRSLSPEEFGKAFAADTTAIVIDVRTPSEYMEGHLHGALLMDVKDEESFGKALECLRSDKTYYVYCRSGRRSLTAAERLTEKGLKAVNMEDGFIGWQKAGLKWTK